MRYIDSRNKNRVYLTGKVLDKNFSKKQGFLDKSKLELKVLFEGETYYILEKGRKAGKLNSRARVDDTISIETKEKYICKSDYAIFRNWIYKIYDYELKHKRKGKKGKKVYRTNEATISLNVEQFCDEMGLFPYSEQSEGGHWWEPQDPRRLRKKGSRICK